MSVELARAVSAGVAVHGLVWRSHLDWIQRHARDNRDLVKMLQVLGGSVVLDQRIRSAGSHHQKFVVIRRPDRPEADVAFVGGIDLSYGRRDDATHAGDPQAAVMPAVFGQFPAWHDAHLEIHGPAVAGVEQCFRERWADPTALQHIPWLWVYDKLRGGVRVSPTLPRALPPPPTCGPHAVQLLRTYPPKWLSYPFAPDGERSVARGFAKALRNARRLVYVEDQFLLAQTVAQVFADALRRASALRMVVVLPAHPDEDGRTLVGVNTVAQRRALEVIHAAGGDRVQVHVLENHEGNAVYVHAKHPGVDQPLGANSVGGFSRTLPPAPVST